MEKTADPVEHSQKDINILDSLLWVEIPDI
jgi:hypothetical protein